MPIRRLIALAAMAGLILVLVACGGGSKSGATKTPAKKTPGVTRTVAPKTTGTPGGTPGAPTTTSPGGTNGGGDGSQQPTNAPRPTSITGVRTTYRVQFAVGSDPANIRQLVEQHGRQLPSRVTVTIGNGQIQFDAPRPFVRVGGTIDAAGSFTTAGTGSVDPYRNVEVTFTGTLSNGQLTGSYAIGTNGALPGAQPVTYNVTGTAQSTGERTPIPTPS